MADHLFKSKLILKNLKEHIYEKQRNELTDEEFKKLPIPEEVIKIAHGPVVTKNPEIKLTVLQKFSQLLKTWECSGQLPAIKVS